MSSSLPRRPTRLALAVLAFSLVSSALIGITIILLGDFDETEMRVLATAGSVAGFSILALPSLFHFERARYTYLTWLGISSTLALFTMVLLGIWSWNDLGGETFYKTLASVGVTAFATNHALLLLIPTTTKILISLCQWATILIITIVCVMILGIIWTEEMPDIMMRLFGALGVLDALGTVLVPILVKTLRPR